MSNKKAELTGAKKSLGYQAEFKKAFTTSRVPGGWTFTEITYEPDSGLILDQKTTEPDIRAVAEERFKIAVVRYWNEMANQGYRGKVDQPHTEQTAP